MITYVVLPDPSDVGVTTVADELGKTTVVDGFEIAVGEDVVAASVTVEGKVGEELEVIAVDVVRKLEVKPLLSE